MLISKRVWSALLDAGVTVRQHDSVAVELAPADGSGPGVRVHVHRRSAPLSPSHVRALLDTDLPIRDRPRLLIVPSATRAALDAAAAAGWSVITEQQRDNDAVAGVVVLPDRHVKLGTPGPPESVAPVRSGRPAWGAFSIVRRLLAGVAGTQSELAAAAGVTQPRVSQTLRQLQAAGLVRRSDNFGRGRWQPADWDALAQWWLLTYPGPGGISSFWYGLAPVAEQTRVALRVLDGAVARVAVSGDVAADRVAPWRRPAHSVLYAEPHPDHGAHLNTGSTSAALDLTAAALTPADPQTATLELIVPTDHGVWPPTGPLHLPVSDVPLADTLQIVWDVRRSAGSDADQAVQMLLLAARDLVHVGQE